MISGMDLLKQFGFPLAVAAATAGLMMTGVIDVGKPQPKSPYLSADAALPEKAAADELPKSVLHYPSLEEERKNGERTVPCYLDEKYGEMIAARRRDAGAALTATASIGGDTLEIYTAPDGAFFAVVKGPDALNRTEACEVAAGTGWTPAPAADLPAPAAPAGPTAPPAPAPPAPEVFGPPAPQTAPATAP